MKFRILSDIHNEFLDTPYQNDSGYKILSLPDDKETTLLLAGDVGLLAKPRTILPFLDKVSEQFKDVFYIPGNHEWYKGNMDKHNVEQLIAEYPNVHTKQLVYEDEMIAVLGCTLWTDFENGNPLSMMECDRYMNDYSAIRVGTEYARFKPEFALYLHYKQKKELLFNVDHYLNRGYKVIVVTHHHPSWQSVLPQYKGHPANGAYVSDMDFEIRTREISYWIAGHIHTAFEYKIENTTILCNPVGYLTHNENSGYDPTKTIEL